MEYTSSHAGPFLSRPLLLLSVPPEMTRPTLTVSLPLHDFCRGDGDPQCTGERLF